ncbi:hypothetical protein BDZ94DRAFT_743072 [Collybia nuda]|uniref:F-box domain-containing protein n=1 Tax=Collybia nuda TaxID=64659 RepID=A0A9P5Y2U1_9AGAR|nr:hypothetical protein BDZ94DRAFT_743072 [Collybia nuda]
MTVTPIYIPQDVINSIVNELYDDKQALSQCSLAAHIFCEPCQRHLYARIDLDNNAEDGNRKLEETLTEYPHIQFYIRHLRLRLISRYGRVRDEGALPEILHMLPRVRSFSLSHGITTGLLHFGTLSQPLKASVFDLLQYGQLTRVELSHLQEFPIYYFSRCSQLRELSLSDVNPFHNDMYFEHNTELVPVSKPVPKTQLQTLSLEMESNPSWSFVHPQTFHHIRSSIDLSHLTSINIGHLFVNEEIDECRKILESTKFLEDLTLTLDLSHGMTTTFKLTPSLT